ncbi:MAG: ABC transporter permease [Hyphomicrobiaceae bacterium]
MVADRRAGVELGDRVRLGRTSFTVVGLTQNQVASGGDAVVFITLLDAQKLQFDLAPPAARVQVARGSQGTNRDTVNAVVARVAPAANLEAVAEVARRWRHLAALTQAERERILAESLVDRARRQIGMFTSILLLVSALIIYTMTMDKLRQIAMLKLIGAPDRTTVGMIVQQALALGLTGFAFGALIIANIKDYFPRRVVLEPDNVLALGAVSGRTDQTLRALDERQACSLVSEGSALIPQRSWMVMLPASSHVRSAPIPRDLSPGQVARLIRCDQSSMSSTLARRAQTNLAGASMHTDPDSLIIGLSFDAGALKSQARRTSRSWLHDCHMSPPHSSHLLVAATSRADLSQSCDTAGRQAHPRQTDQRARERLEHRGRGSFRRC